MLWIGLLVLKRFVMTAARDVAALNVFGSPVQLNFTASPCNQQTGPFLLHNPAIVSAYAVNVSENGVYVVHGAIK
jgi:hypothetical protein